VLHSLAKLALQLALVMAAIGLVAIAIRRGRPGRGDVRAAAGPGIAAVLAVLAAVQLGHALSDFDHARRSAVSAGAGRDHCFAEYGAGGVKRLAFISWVRQQIGPRAVYQLDYAGPPDLLCVTFALLPALEALPGERADWLVADGVISPRVHELIARHDRSVRVFGPGLALVRTG
jgi:hypothetical protein